MFVRERNAYDGPVNIYQQPTVPIDWFPNQNGWIDSDQTIWIGDHGR